MQIACLLFSYRERNNDMQIIYNSQKDDSPHRANSISPRFLTFNSVLLVDFPNATSSVFFSLNRRVRCALEWNPPVRSNVGRRSSGAGATNVEAVEVKVEAARDFELSESDASVGMNDSSSACLASVSNGPTVLSLALVSLCYCKRTSPDHDVISSKDVPSPIGRIGSSFHLITRHPESPSFINAGTNPDRIQLYRLSPRSHVGAVRRSLTHVCS